MAKQGYVVSQRDIDSNTGKPYILCESCGQPMLPKGLQKRKDEYDHASGCPEEQPHERT